MVAPLERKHRCWTQALKPGTPLSPSEQQSLTLILIFPLGVTPAGNLCHVGVSRVLALSPQAGIGKGASIALGM